MMVDHGSFSQEAKIPTESGAGKGDGRQPIETAPQDGTWITGIDKDGREARIQSRVTHPLVPTLRHWGDGETRMEGNGQWEVSNCFYPTHWKPLANSLAVSPSGYAEGVNPNQPEDQPQPKGEDQ